MKTKVFQILEKLIDLQEEVQIFFTNYKIYYSLDLRKDIELHVEEIWKRGSQIKTRDME